MKNLKKGQLKIQQMSFMLMAIFLFFILVGLFYVVINMAQLKQSVRTLEIERVVGLTARISSLPEMNFQGKVNAIDGDKIMIIKNRDKYKEFFGINGMIIRKVDGKSKDVECSSSNYPDCNLIKVFTKENISTTPSSTVFVALCRKQTLENNAYDKCELARVAISIEEKE
jgi:hypothetical protein